MNTYRIRNLITAIMLVFTAAIIVSVWATDIDTSTNPEQVAMKVHEWGTFTVVQGSDGRSINWYQQPKDIVDLPDFVRSNGGIGKTGTRLAGMDLIRMETPVLYFYPDGDQPVDITVAASFKHGRITEVFPPAFNGNPGKTVWRGTLLPPDAPERNQVPASEGPEGRHYGAARAVPEAWLFRGEEDPKMLKAYTDLRAVQPDHPLLPDLDAKPVDHFIFYRGAGSPSSIGIQARQSSKDPNKYTLRNDDKATIPTLFALRVRDGKGSWLAINDLEKAKYDRAKRGTVNEQSFVFPEPTQSVTDLATQLGSFMVAALVKEGLTMPEAAAMVATWDNLWFTEPGTRVLAILPQSHADKMVPLEITPKPNKIERVFVARLELINRDQEAQLMAVLNDPDARTDELSNDAKRLMEIQLGRYSAGGMERAMELVTRQMRNRFYALDKAKPEPQSKELTLAQ